MRRLHRRYVRSEIRHGAPSCPVPYYSAMAPQPDTLGLNIEPYGPKSTIKLTSLAHHLVLLAHIAIRFGLALPSASTRHTYGHPEPCPLPLAMLLAARHPPLKTS